MKKKADIMLIDGYYLWRNFIFLKDDKDKWHIRKVDNKEQFYFDAAYENQVKIILSKLFKSQDYKIYDTKEIGYDDRKLKKVRIDSYKFKSLFVDLKNMLSQNDIKVYDFGISLAHRWMIEKQGKEYNFVDSKDRHIWLLDIEVDFPQNIRLSEDTILEANYPLQSITFYDTKLKKYYLLLVKPSNLTNEEIYQILKSSELLSPYKDILKIYLYETERQMLEHYLLLVQTIKPSYIMGWNLVMFDISYIGSRLKQYNLVHLYSAITSRDIGMAVKEYNEKTTAQNKKITTDEYETLLQYIHGHIEETYFTQKGINTGRKYIKIYSPGIEHIDLLDWYRNILQKNVLSYSLDYVAQIELGIGKTEKQGYKYYREAIDKFIAYALRDVEILVRMYNEYKISIQLFFEYQKFVCVNFNEFYSPTKRIEALMMKLSYQNNKILESNINPNKFDNTSYEGAIVFEPKLTYIETPVIVFDATSMYPTTMMSFNISKDTLIPYIDITKGVYLKYVDISKYKNTLAPKRSKLRLIQFLLKQFKHIFRQHQDKFSLIKSNILNNQESQKVEEILSYLIDLIPTLKEYIVFLDDKIRIFAPVERYYKLFFEDSNTGQEEYRYYLHDDKIGINTLLLNTIFPIRVKYKNIVKEYKKKLKNITDKTEKQKLIEEMNYYDIIQNVYKITMNSLYGVNGTKHFRVIHPALAQSITGLARELIKWFKSQVESIDLSSDKWASWHKLFDFDKKGKFVMVTYGDTDSVFVVFPFKDNLQYTVGEIEDFAQAFVKEINNNISKFVHKYVYPQSIQLPEERIYQKFGVDKIFKKFYQKVKKQYIGIDLYSDELMFKGGFLVKRTTSNFAKDKLYQLSKKILEGTFEENDLYKIENELHEIINNIYNAQTEDDITSFLDLISYVTNIGKDNYKTIPSHLRGLHFISEYTQTKIAPHVGDLVRVFYIRFIGFHDKTAVDLYCKHYNVKLIGKTKATVSYEKISKQLSIPEDQISLVVDLAKKNIIIIDPIAYMEKEIISNLEVFDNISYIKDVIKSYREYINKNYKHKIITEAKSYLNEYFNLQKKESKAQIISMFGK